MSKLDLDSATQSIVRLTCEMFVRFQSNQLLSWIILLMSAVLSACAVGPDFHRPAAATDKRYTNRSIAAVTAPATTVEFAPQQFDSARDIPADWWNLFHSDALSGLVNRALKANPDLAAARASLIEAQENFRAEEGTLFPTITASGSATRSRNLIATGAGSTAVSANDFSASVSASYTLDVFGGIRRAVEQLGAQTDYERFELEAAYLTLTSNVVTAALNEASLQAQIKATQEIIRVYTEQLDITRRRFAHGGVSLAEVLEQQTSLASATATLPPLQKQLDQQRNQLAVYLGVHPGDFEGSKIDLADLSLPEGLPVSLPSKLVDQRPDIRAYEALLHSATANVGIATANMLPQFTLTGSYGGESERLSDLFSPSGVVWSLASGLTQPVFDGGTLLHRKRSAEAALQTAAAQYSSTVNSAFQDVANALVAIEQDAKTLQADLLTEKLAAESLDVSQSQFRAGASAYLTVLTAEQSYQSARLSMVSAEANRFTDTVALYKALGGGWWNRDDINAAIATEMIP